MTDCRTMSLDEMAEDRPVSPKPLEVLVVEDDPDMRSLLREVLEMDGMNVTVAADGFEADRLASERGYDVVVSDIRIPGIDGVELTRRLGKGLAPPRVILITAYPTPRTVELGYIAGARRVLPKPFSLRQFARLVEEVGRKRRPPV